ncbi:MAG: DUF177 domain-containing protein [Halioglobus sp.]|nr:DUF177 domain-containing protein [Halioglobus sp.]MCB1709485.1 DUF177 domain-containing protein [Halioglobus sp.]MCP5122222.1 DUF177 domain-containing protein [Pseudomonadales bacterium]MCP5192233.1 DUF177 domain-containing protein [Pseudomonadales bacterium]
MLSEPLPSTLDVRKAAARGVSVRGALKPLDLQRFRALLADDDGVIQAGLSFTRDEENRYIIQLAITAEVVVTCQRCLEPLPHALACDNTLAVVWTDEQAAHLPRHLEPLVVEDEACNLWDVVEDELILALPSFSYHDTGECQQILARFNAAEAPSEEVVPVEKPNPFNVLAQLKPGSKT